MCFAGNIIANDIVASVYDDAYQSEAAMHAIAAPLRWLWHLAPDVMRSKVGQRGVMAMVQLYQQAGLHAAFVNVARSL